MIEGIRKYGLLILLIALGLIIYFPVFLHLDYMPIRMWDEALAGVNAVEMMHNHNYIVTYASGQPDLYVTKPPLLIWLIILCSKIIGFNELSLRLPSAIAAAGLCLYLFIMLRKYTGDSIFGFIVVIVLVTCNGYIRNHVTRTGEYDSLLVAFSTVFSFHVFLATQAGDKPTQSKHLFLFFVFLTLAVLSKGITCFMLAPGLFIYSFFKKRITPFLKTRGFYAGLAFFIVFGLGYYLLRELKSPGYLAAVWNNELGGRFGSAMEGHRGPFFFYLEELFTWQFVNYVYVFPVALIVGLIVSPPAIKRLVIFSLCIGFCFLIVISKSETKLPHYDALLFPYLAIITAAFFYFVYSSIKAYFSEKNFAGKIVAVFCVFLLLAKPYYDIIQKVYFPKGDYWEEGFSVTCRYFQAAAKHKVDIASYRLIFNAPLSFPYMNVITCYREELEEKGLPVNLVDYRQLQPGDKAVLFDSWLKPQIESVYNVTSISQLDFCSAEILNINGRKDLSSN